MQISQIDRLDMILNKISSSCYVMHTECGVRCIRMRVRVSMFSLIFHSSKPYHYMLNTTSDAITLHIVTGIVFSNGVPIACTLKLWLHKIAYASLIYMTLTCELKNILR
jgi:hypothetical protein